MSDTVLDAAEHFGALRDAVWMRVRARHGAAARDRFDDAYAEWWTREVERAAAGRPSRAGAPAAFVAEAVHRVLIDDARARARGLARDEKASLALVDLDDQRDVAHAGDTSAAAHYEALVHRVLALVRARLSERELAVFVWSYLYLQTSERTAAALNLSPPRVKKDRKRVATKVGEEVWAVLSGELALCAAYHDKRLAAAFELMTDHVEDCRECRAALGGVRRGAMAVVAPVELIALVGVTEPLGVLDLLYARCAGLVHRASELATSVPPAGRGAAAVAMAAAAVGGGVAAHAPDPPRPAPVRERAAAVRPPAPVPTVTATATPERRPVRPVRARRKARPPAPAAPAATAAPPPPVTPAPVAAAAAAATTAPTGGEFGFERD